MIRLFNDNKPFLVPLLLVYALLMGLPMFIAPQHFAIPDAHAPLSKLVLGLLGRSHYLAAISSVVLVFVQALIVTQMVNSTKLFARVNYVPALLYVLCASMFTDMLYPGPGLLANTFVALVMLSLSELWKQQRAFMEIYDVGFLIALASLFYAPVLAMVVLMYIALGILRPFSWKEWLTALLGIVTPYFLIGTYYFMIDSLPAFINEQFGQMFSFSGMYYQAELAVQVIGPYVLVLLLLAAWYLQATYLKSQIQVRKFLILLVWALIILFFSFLLSDGLHLKHFVIISVPLSVILSYYLLHFKKQRFAEIIHAVLVLLILFFQYFSVLQ